MSNQLVHLPVSEIMTPYLVTINQYANLAEAYEIMVKDKIRRIPVVDKDKLIGIITLRDIQEAKPSDIRHSLNQDEVNELLSTILVEHVMKHPPLTVYQTDTMGHAAEIMLEKKIGGIPVIDANKKLVGLVTESDIFRTIVRQWRTDNLIHSGV